MRGKRLARAQAEMCERWTAMRQCYRQMKDGPERAALARQLFGSWSKQARQAKARAAREVRHVQ